MTITAPTNSTVRDARLDFRLQREHKRLIEQAAAVSGQSLSEFALSQLIEVSRTAVARATVTRLNQHDRDAFIKLIADDAEPNAALRAAAKRYRRRSG